MAPQEEIAHHTKEPAPYLCLWKSRLPAIVVPLLSGLRCFRQRDIAHPVLRQPAGLHYSLLLLIGIAVSTGYWRLPFSVTWWLVLAAAFALETDFLIGVATVLSLTVLLGWYGLRFQHPHAVMALWGGAGRKEEDETDDYWQEMAAFCWRAWDICVHGIPAVLVLVWYGPGQDVPGNFNQGIVSLSAALMAATMNVLWLWGLGMGKKPRCWLPWPFNSMQLRETNMAYHVVPQLPDSAWRWAYSSHWAACLLWAAALVLPKQVAFVYAVFGLMGFTKIPYTAGWCIIFVTALWTSQPRQWGVPEDLAMLVESIDSKLLQGMVCCCALTTAVGFYGTQVIAPYTFKSLVHAWVLNPVKNLAPKRFSETIEGMGNSERFFLSMRVGDLFMHLLPTSTAVWLFQPVVTWEAALFALPTNMLWLCCTGSTSLRATSEIYGVKPPLTDSVLGFIYGSHILLCSTVALFCAAFR